MAEDSSLGALQALYRELTLVSDALKADRDERGRTALLRTADLALLEAVAADFQRLLDKPARKKESRDAVLSGKVSLPEGEWTLNKDFQEIILQVADDLDLDELEATRLAIEAEDDEATLGRSRKECAIIRFHQQRKYLLSCMLLLLEFAKEEDEFQDDGVEGDFGRVSQYVNLNILRGNTSGALNSATRHKFVPACMAAMADIRAWLQRISEHVNSAAVLGRAPDPAAQETIEFSRMSLMQQHELLAIILCYAIDNHMANESDFINFLQVFRNASRYDFSIVHLVPVLGTFITVFGSPEGTASIEQARKLNEIICKHSDNTTRAIPFLDSAIRAWWIVEYSGWYMDDAAGSGLPDIDLDEEDKQRARQFTEALKDGAFDFMLAVAADVKATEWQDPSRNRLRHWAQKRTPPLPPDTVPFSPQLQERIASTMDVFVDAFISNMPDVLRKLKIEEDEQRQTSQLKEQDLDLERFLLIIAYTYEGRPRAAENFWADPESNLAGFLQWASRRTTTPLQTAFCEMLQCLSDDAETATCAHEFLLDEGHQLRRPSSITWVHILKEMAYFVNKVRQKPTAVSHAVAPRGGKYGSEETEDEAEIIMLQESYLRLITKLASQSEPARLYLLQLPNESLVELLFQAISSAVGPQIRAYAFGALGALMSRKSLLESYAMWRFVESCFTGVFISPDVSARNQNPVANLPSPSFFMEALFQEMSPNMDETGAFIQFLTVLSSLPENFSPLNDALPFPEDLGAATRTRPGIEPYIDFILGHMFSMRAPEAHDPVHQRVLRFYCLDFALSCVSSFNEDLIVFGNVSNINVDSAIQTKDLETYVSLHPFARVMEWMYDSRFMKGLLDTIHQNPSDIGRATPDSPLILGVLRAVTLLSKALDLQVTYLDVVRRYTKPQNRNPSRSFFTPTSNASFTSLEDGLVTSLTLISDLGGYCGIGHPDLTLASLKLLEKISTSPKIITAWQSGPSNQNHRNKAIVALEEHGDAQTISGAFAAELKTPLDEDRKADSPEYQTKVYILDFLYSCLKANRDRPTIAHLLLGFHCSTNALEIEPESAFDERSALFHLLLQIAVEVPPQEEGNMVAWLVCLKYKAMRILKLLWSSPLSAAIVLEELRENDFLFHILLQGLVTQQSDFWDGEEAKGPDFLTTAAAQSYVEYLSMRAMALEYITHELCSVSQSQMPALKRRIFDALGGQISIDGMESIQVPSVFQFHDSLPQSDFAAPEPEWESLRGFDPSPCLEHDDDGNPIYNLEKVQEMLLLKRSEGNQSTQLVLQQDAALWDIEEEHMLLWLRYLNRLSQIRAYSLKVLGAWTRLLMIMTSCNDFKGTNSVSFILQTLQAILPGLEMYGAQNPVPALELAKLAQVLLFKLDFATMTSADKQSRAVENLTSDKLFQLLQICLNAIAAWSGNQELRAVYYSICYSHLTGMLDHDRGSLSGLQKTTKTIQSFGEKLLNVVCDDAFGGDIGCQSAALVFLNTLVRLCRQDKSNYVVEALNRLNFIGILVDSLKDVLAEWLETGQTGDPDYQSYLDAKLALLLQLCQTRDGAKYVLHANIFRTVEASGLFAADPELSVEPTDTKALERHYLLLVKIARIIGVAIISRGSHNILQGRRFLTSHRMLIMHVLKRSAGIGAGAGKMDAALAERIDELAEAFMIIISATGFLEFENQTLPEHPADAPMLFH
ncbi:nucleoporin Nup186/Nup192/Nup205 [Xylariaceae sp. FL1272]|nr:nucleoporin Nup186/Nup192/Nup205 [Xylariaceae sp. FL1272]